MKALPIILPLRPCLTPSMPLPPLDAFLSIQQKLYGISPILYLLDVEQIKAQLTKQASGMALEPTTY